MPTVVIKPGATVFVTGVNGLVGSYIADQLLLRGYNVRGAVRNVEKTEWLVNYFTKKYSGVRFELVGVPDMTVGGCYDSLVQGVEGFIHVASPLGGIFDLEAALDIGRNAGINALKACANSPSVKRFVNTSSSLAATLPKPHLAFDAYINNNAYNEEALEKARTEEGVQKGLFIYAAMKSETEKAMWKWVEENKPGFVFNSILPNVNFGPVLIPEHQGYPSTIDWARAAWTGERLDVYTKIVQPQWFISLCDSALLHISALIYAEVDGERLFGWAERWNYNQLLTIYGEHYPEKSFPKHVEGLGYDRVSAPTKRAEEVLRWIKGIGWDGLEESVVAMSRDW